MVNIAVDTSRDRLAGKENPSPCRNCGLVLSNRFRLDTNLPVYLSGDGEVLQGAISDVLEAVRNAGVQKVAFMVRRRGGQPCRP
jgi:biopolymer transport protein ExbD